MRCCCIFSQATEAQVELCIDDTHPFCLCSVGDCAPPNPRALAAAKVMPSARFSPDTSPYGLPHRAIKTPTNPQLRKPTASHGQHSSNGQTLHPRSSQLTASLRGTSTSAPASRPPARAANREAESSKAASHNHQQGIRRTTVHAVTDAAGQQQQLPGAHSRLTAAQGRINSREGGRTQQQQLSGLQDGAAANSGTAAGNSTAPSGLHAAQQGPPTASAVSVQAINLHAAPTSTGAAQGPLSSEALPAKASYASKVAENVKPVASVATQAPMPQGQHRNRHRQHPHKGKGRQQAEGDFAVLATQPSQLNPEANPFTAMQQQTPAVAPAAAPTALDTMTAPTCAPSSELQSMSQARQSATGLHTGQQRPVQHQRHQQHPPFRDSPAHMLQSPFLPASDGSASAESSLGAENRDPALQPAAPVHKAEPTQPTPIRPTFMASPFTALNTLPSFTKPLSPSKALEFPSAFGSQRASQEQAATTSPPGANPSSRQGSPVQPRRPHTQPIADSSQRATAPPEATDTTALGHPHANHSTSPASSASTQQQPPTLAALAALNGNNVEALNGQHKHAEPPSPTTPLALALASTSDGVTKKESSGKAHSIASDLGFSLLWDDDPFWQVW